MKLSIIVPVYNGEKFINKSYNSIMNQDLDSIEHEILFINNNSMDSSKDIIEGLMAKNSNIKLFNQVRQGEAQARNMGIEKAIGDYVYQLDVDDEVFPHALKKMITVLDNHLHIDAVFGKMLKTNKTLADISTDFKESHEITFYEKPTLGLKWFSDLSKVVGEAAFMHRRNVFKVLGLYTENLPIIGTDLAFDIKLGMLSNLAFIDIYVYLYYKHQISTIQEVKKKMPRAFMVWPRLVKEHVPFYYEYQPGADFKRMLAQQLYASMGRQLVFTKQLEERKELRQRLVTQLQPFKLPLVIRSFLSILVWQPRQLLLKLYLYKVVPNIVNSSFNKI